MADEPENLVLIHLQGMRREMGAMLERQLRDRELISKVYNELMAVRPEIQGLHAEIRDVKTDLILLENQMQNRHNEVLQVVRRHRPARGADRLSG